jgi:hypothetical protein
LKSAGRLPRQAGVAFGDEGRRQMGAHAYWYTVKHQPNTQKALDELREREFKAGRYNPVVPFLDFPIADNAPAPGAGHDSIEEAMQDAAEDGTRSILDILAVGDQPDFCTAGPLRHEVLQSLYGTTQPSREMVELNMDFLEDLERGHCVYVELFKDGKPDELFFAGYSFD